MINKNIKGSGVKNKKCPNLNLETLETQEGLDFSKMSKLARAGGVPAFGRSTAGKRRSGHYFHHSFLSFFPFFPPFFFFSPSRPFLIEGVLG